MKTPLVLAAFFGASVFPLLGTGSGEPILRPFALMGNPPPVQMIVPGFVVRQLPVQLSNVNNLSYGPDGKLYAYAFDGNVYRLEDTDGDGLEDKSTHFFKNENDEIVGSVGMVWGPDKNLYLPAASGSSGFATKATARLRSRRSPRAGRRQTTRARGTSMFTASLLIAPEIFISGSAFQISATRTVSINKPRNRSIPVLGIAARFRKFRRTVNAKSSLPAFAMRFHLDSTAGIDRSR